LPHAWGRDPRSAVLRDSTERPEGVASGAAKLVGTDPAAMARASMPYGDGHAAGQIATHIPATVSGAAV